MPEVPIATDRSVSYGPRHRSFWPLGSELLVSVSIWTSITNDSSVVQRLLALYFCWEYPVFVSLSKEHFIRDFSKGKGRYCSPMLVNALLSLGYCFSSQQIGTATIRLSSPSGTRFFEESQRLFDAEADHHSLTTVQALGIMSLRESSCGRDSHSHYYAEQSIRLAIEMGMHEVDKGMDSDQSVVIAATFWGAFGLHHAWASVSNSLPSCSSRFTSAMPPKPAHALDIADAVWVPYTDDDATVPQQHAQTWHIGAVSNCSWEFSEIIHESLYILHRPRHPPTSKELLHVYTKYLNWYGLLPEFFRLGDDCTPAVLFAHMYYHFAILQLFQPFITLNISGSDISPRDVCLEAANSITALVQAYSQLHTLRRTPSFMSHLILTSSIMYLSISPGLSVHHHHNPQSDFLLITQITSALRQTVTNLAEMAPCHHSAKRAYRIVGALAKKERITLNYQTALSLEGPPPGVGMASIGPSFDMLMEKRLEKWEKQAGRFVGIFPKPTTGMQESDNPPFWLIKKQLSEVSSDQAIMETMGFVALSRQS